MKKASLNLSINAIVVLILAITMLALALGFIRGTFRLGTEGVNDQLKTIDEGRRNAFLDECQDDSCLEVTSIEIERNKKEVILLALNNKLDSDIAEVSITTFGTGGHDDCQKIDTSADCRDIEITHYENQRVDSRKKELIPINIFVKNTATPTTYRYRITVFGEVTPGDPNTLTLEQTLYLDVVVV